MIHSLLKTVDRLGLIKSASAHCDIPCGIYDPGPAIIAALSVVRLMDLMHAGEANQDLDAVGRSNVVTRNAVRKEEEAEKVKHEIRIIWGDYFKAPLIDKHPNIHALTHQIMQKASACKQGVNRADGEALVELVNQFAEVFWETKGVKSERRTCPYEPKLPAVYPQL